jgi:RNA polymerase sigma-70 factor (ECF subfamily)
VTQNYAAGLADDELVNQAKGGDRDAFSELMRRHYKATLSLASSILRNRTDAEDEVQNAWCKAIEHIQQFQGDAKFSTWMTRIVVNQCLMRLRHFRRARLLYMEDLLPLDERSTFELRDHSPTAEQQLGRTQAAKVVHHEIGRIPPLLRKVMVLRDVEQRSMNEVAENLGISVAAAKSRLLRARLELRNRLTRHCGRLGPATLTA